MAPKGRCLARRLEGERIGQKSDTEEGQRTRQRSHMLKEEGCWDKTSDFRALPRLLAKVCLPRWDDVMTCEKMLRVETGGCQNESKRPAAMKIALIDSSVSKCTPFAERESHSSNSFNTKRDGSNQLRLGLKKQFFDTTTTVPCHAVLRNTMQSGSGLLEDTQVGTRNKSELIANYKLQLHNKYWSQHSSRHRQYFTIYFTFFNTNKIYIF